MKNINNRIKKVAKFLQQKKIVGKPLNDILAKSLMIVVIVVSIVGILPTERPFEYSNLTVGSIARDEIIAPFTFPIIKSQERLNTEREQARQNVPMVFRKETNPEEIQIIKLKNLFVELSNFFKQLSGLKKEEDSTEERLVTESKIDSLINQIYIKYNLSLTPDHVNKFYELFTEEGMFDLEAKISAGISKVYSQGILEIPLKQVEGEKITVIENGLEEVTDISRLLDLDEAEREIVEHLSEQYSASSSERRLGQVIIPAFLSPQLIYDRDLTRTRKEKAVHEVPTTSGFVHENQRIVDSHEIVTEDIYLKLQSLAESQKERSLAKSGWHQILFFIGKYLIALIITLMYGMYIYFYRPKYFRDNKMLLLITTVMILQIFFTFLIDDILEWSYLSIPVTLAPMLLSMLLDASIAFLGTVILSIILGAAMGNNFFLALMVFIVGTTALFSVQKIRNRGQMFRAILYILFGYAVLNFSYGFMHFVSFRDMFQNFLFYELPNAILVPTAVFLLIGIFEKFFDVTTDITLLELSDLNHPLLKRLSVEAPGTFHHSITVGNLAEAAAKEIGANSLLARVGCYYHDIGKMQRAEYFVENQVGTINKHENLTPNMSSLILSKHVKAGLELADRYKLPQAVKKFIPEHHGTNLMAYFYHKAQETMNPKDFNENDFRYPGPKPQSKETAIAMLADAVEAASRTLPNPNLQRLSALVENLIEKRFQEGELDKCDVTLRELNRIKEAFIPILMGINHLRIDYPKGGDKDKIKQTASEKSEKSDTKKFKTQAVNTKKRTTQSLQNK